MENTFISQHTHYCDCGCEDKMIEYIVTNCEARWDGHAVTKSNDTWHERQCLECNRKYKVAKVGDTNDSQV